MSSSVEPLTPEALDTIEAESKGKIMNAHSVTAEEYARIIAKVYEPDLDWEKPADYDLLDRGELTAMSEKTLAVLAWNGFVVQRADDVVLDEVELRRLRTENEEQRAKIDAALAVPEWSFDGDTAAIIRAALTGEATE